MNLPNLLSLVRVALVPCFAIVYLSSIPNAGFWAGCIFVVAALTDMLDGYLARKWNQITKLGRILDPLADKLLQVTAVACLAVQKVVPIFFFLVFAGKELFMLVGGMFLVKRTDDVMASNLFGKAVSFLISILIVVTIFFKDYIHPRTTQMLYTIAVTLALAAMAMYVVLYLKNQHSSAAEETSASPVADE